MPDQPRTLYAAYPPVKVPFARAFTDRGHAERACQPDHDWQVVPYHQLPTSGPERDKIVQALAEAINVTELAAEAVYDALLQHYNQETD